MSRVSSCHHAFADISWIRIFCVGILWVQIFLLWIFRGSVIIILVSILWIQNFFTWVFRQSKPFFVFCGSKGFPRRYFVGQISYLVDILQVHIFFSWVFVDPNIYLWVFHGFKYFFCRSFVIPKFFLVDILWV